MAGRRGMEVGDMTTRNRNKTRILGVTLAAALAALTAGTASAQIPSGVTYETLYDHATTSFNHPTFVGPVPGDANQLIVVERKGAIWRLVKSGAQYVKTAWFTVNANTATHWDGAWAVEFHPKFAQNRLFYILYRLEGADTRSVIEEWTCDANLANPKKVRNIIFFNQKSIHSSGDIKFGPDGYLYSAQGDRAQGGLQGGQLMSELWGKVIRIDVDRKDPGLEYAIPDGNPYKGQAGIRPEIWASGFRVPYRISFDRVGGDMYLGDVGDVTAEEVNLVLPGKNYGSGTVEGTCRTNCAAFTNPVLALPRGCVIGGYVYRNDPTSAWYGVYIYADFQNSKLLALKLNEAKTGVVEQKQIATSVPQRISAMGQDAAGNYYIATYLENPEDSKTHIYRLKHDQLRPAAVGVNPRLAGPRPGLSAAALAAGGWALYGMDGKAVSPGALKSRDAGVLLVRDPATGAVRKQVRLP
jgi:glucose/arabinose dehydrogenase